MSGLRSPVSGLPLLLILLGSSAHAGSLYSEADLGATFFLGSGGSHADPGPAFAARIGWEPRGWLTLGAFVYGSTHEATVPTPSSGELFQLYLVGADLRFTVRTGRIGLFAGGSGGIAFLSTNVLESVMVTEPGRERSPYLRGGGGLEYHTDNPRFALGLSGDYGVYFDYSGLQSVSAFVYLRYTR
jgi:hypothetical protein